MSFSNQVFYGVIKSLLLHFMMLWHANYQVVRGYQLLLASNVYSCCFSNSLPTCNRSTSQLLVDLTIVGILIEAQNYSRVVTMTWRLLCSSVGRNCIQFRPVFGIFGGDLCGKKKSLHYIKGAKEEISFWERWGLLHFDLLRRTLGRLIFITWQSKPNPCKHLWFAVI